MVKNEKQKRTKKNRPKIRAARLRVKGKGNYIVDTGESIGKSVGGWLGNKAGGLISSIVSGSGDYKIKTNSLMNQVPDFGNSAEVRLCHREFLRDILAQTAFTPLIIPIQITQLGLFPWLSRWAKAFDEVEFNGLIFNYKTLSGAISSSQALGSVIMATQYNPYDANFADKQTMENYQYSSSTVPSVSCLHAVECDPAMRQQPILSVVQPEGAGDLRYTTLGKFTLAVVGCPAAAVGQVLGELWVTYDITLRRKAQRSLGPKSVISIPSGIDDTHALGTSSTVEGDTIATIDHTLQALNFGPSVYGNFDVSVYLNYSTAGPSTGQLVPTFTSGSALDTDFFSSNPLKDGELVGKQLQCRFVVRVTGGAVVDIDFSGATGQTWTTGEIVLMETDDL
jgi:hypothetical protein